MAHIAPPPPRLLDYENAERRRHPAIFREAPSSAQLGPDQLDLMYLSQLRAASDRSRYVELEQAFSQLRDQLSALRSLAAGWDGYRAPAPNEVAFAAAEAALGTLRRLNVRPAGILPSSDGGIGIYFSQNERYAHMELVNDGDTWVLMYGPAGTPESWQLPSSGADSIRDAWTSISAYLQR
jgi:hypothetical protein